MTRRRPDPVLPFATRECRWCHIQFWGRFRTCEPCLATQRRQRIEGPPGSFKRGERLQYRNARRTIDEATKLQED